MSSRIRYLKVSLLAMGTVFLATAISVFEHRSLSRQYVANVAVKNPPTPNEIPNFSVVHPYLFRGALPTPFGMEWLKQHGVKTIVDLREAGTPPVIGERITAERMGFNYVNLPVRNMPAKDQISRFRTIVAQARAGAGPVFIHCNYGADRTGFFIFTWRVIEDKWRWTLALCEMIEKGFFVHKFSENKTAPLADPANW